MNYLNRERNKNPNETEEGEVFYAEKNFEDFLVEYNDQTEFEFDDQAIHNMETVSPLYENINDKNLALLDSGTLIHITPRTDLLNLTVTKQIFI